VYLSYYLTHTSAYVGGVVGAAASGGGGASGCVGLSGASCGCITGRMERALSSAFCVFRGIGGRWCRYWQGGVSERVSDALARGLGCCKVQRETSRLILSCRQQATARRQSEKGTSLDKLQGNGACASCTPGTYSPDAAKTNCTVCSRRERSFYLRLL
jgi:hypothetical protein